MIELKALASYVNSQIPACKFVGLSNEGELFVQFEHDNSQYMEEAQSKIIQQFPEVKKVVAVVQPSLQQLQSMVDALNETLEGPEKFTPKNKDLLTIGGF